jgi:cob(I)alamin adenosyltransferase
MRLGKITTRTGDDGSTGLADGTRVAKNSARITALGALDELNSHLGLLLCASLPQDVCDLLHAIQHDLFDLGGTLATANGRDLTPGQLARLDDAIAHYNTALPPLREFILPGGTQAAALCHVCRTVARRAERDLVNLGQAEPLPVNNLPYLNRLSDLLFVLARTLNRDANLPEPQWQTNPR